MIKGKLIGRSMKDIYEWQVAVTAYRLCATRENEKIILLKMINNYLEN